MIYLNSKWTFSNGSGYLSLWPIRCALMPNGTMTYPIDRQYYKIHANSYVNDVGIITGGYSYLPQSRRPGTGGGGVCGFSFCTCWREISGNRVALLLMEYMLS